jgi:hypothetical protein
MIAVSRSTDWTSMSSRAARRSIATAALPRHATIISGVFPFSCLRSMFARASISCSVTSAFPKKAAMYSGVEVGSNINVTVSFNQQSRDIHVVICRCRMQRGEGTFVLVVQEGLQVLSRKKRCYFRGVTCDRSLSKVVTHLLSKFLLTRQRLCFHSRCTSEVVP